MAGPLLKTATFSISAPVAVASCQTVLADASSLLQFTLDQSASVNDQIASVYSTRRSTNSTARILRTKVTHLQGIFEEWQSIVSRLTTRETAEVIEKEHDLYREMVENPNGLYATIDQATVFIQQLESLEEDLSFMLSRLDPPLVNTQPSFPTTQQPIFSPPPPSIQLPKIELPVFSGDPLKWFDFWSLFETTVDQQPQLAKVQKLSYLLSCLRGQAREATRGYSLHEDNYDRVVRALNLQFGNKAALGRQLHEQLRKLRSPCHTSVDLMSYHNETSRILHQMEIAGIDTSSEHVIYELEDNLPIATKTLMYPEKMKCQHFKPQDFLTILLNVALMLADIEPSTHLASPRERGDGDNRRQNETFGQYRRSVPNSWKRDNRKHRLPNNQSFDSKRSSAFTGLPRSPTRRNDTRVNDRQRTSMAPSQKQPSPRTPCIFCGSMHWNEDCTQFNSPEMRNQRATQLHLCFLCLRTGHSYQNCAAKKCTHCGRGHHKLLCNAHAQRSINAADSARSAGTTSQAAVQQSSFNATVKAVHPKNPLKGTVPLLLWQSAPIHNPRCPKKTRMARIFLDQGSQSSFVSEKFAKAIGIKCTARNKLTINGVGSSRSRSIQSALVSLGITLTDGSRHILEANTLPQVTNAFLHADTSSIDVYGLEQDEEKLSLPLVEEEPDILIGSNFITTINPKLIHHLRSGFAVYESAIGPLVGGCGHVVSSNISLLPQHAAAVLVGTVQMTLDDLTSLDKLGIDLADETIEDDERALVQFERSVQRLSDGRYSVSWPFKPGQRNLAQNYGLCCGRLQSLLRGLMSKPDRLRLYHETIVQQLADGVIEEVPTRPTGPLVHYIPHQAVWNEEKKKMRVVYDASSSAPRDQALNDNLLRGPVFLPDLAGQLMRLRHTAIALVADVEKAFLQIQLNEEDRDVARFLWIKDPQHPIGPDNPIVAYRFRRVFFGAVSSPFLLAATIRHHLCQSNSPVTSKLFENTYVDNVLFTVDSADAALEAYRQAKSVFLDAKMNLREFISNNESVNEAMPSIDRHDNITIKVLGLTWDTVPDTLTAHTLRPPHAPCNKRILLRFIAQHFDFLGFISPSVLLLKLLWQDVVKNRLQAIQLCETRNSFLRMIAWIGLEDTTVAARMLLGRTNISARLPSHILCNHTVNALDRLGRMGEMVADGESPEETSQWLSSTEELMHEIGHDVRVTTEEIEAVLQSVANRWQWIATGASIILLTVAAAIIWMKCPCPTRQRSRPTEIRIELPQMVTPNHQSSTENASASRSSTEDAATPHPSTEDAPIVKPPAKGAPTFLLYSPPAIPFFPSSTDRLERN